MCYKQQQYECFRFFTHPLYYLLPVAQPGCPSIGVTVRVTGACPVTTDLSMRVNVRTITTTHECYCYYAAVIVASIRVGAGLESPMRQISAGIFCVLAKIKRMNC